MKLCFRRGDTARMVTARNSIYEITVSDIATALRFGNNAMTLIKSVMAALKKSDYGEP